MSTAELWRKTNKMFTLEHQYAYPPHCSLYISRGADKETLFNSQEPFKLVIISFSLNTLMCDLWEWYCKEKLDASHF